MEILSQIKYSTVHFAVALLFLCRMTVYLGYFKKKNYQEMELIDYVIMYSFMILLSLAWPLLLGFLVFQWLIRFEEYLCSLVEKEK